MNPKVPNIYLLPCSMPMLLALPPYLGGGIVDQHDVAPKQLAKRHLCQQKVLRVCGLHQIPERDCIAQPRQEVARPAQVACWATLQTQPSMR